MLRLHALQFVVELIFFCCDRFRKFNTEKPKTIKFKYLKAKYQNIKIDNFSFLQSPVEGITMFSFAFALFILLAFNDVAFSSVIYVSTMSGNDSTTCGTSAALACRSLTEAFSRAQDNDTVQLSAGELFPVTDTLNVTLRNLTLRSDASARAVVWCDGSALPMILFEAIESFVLENVDFRGAGTGFNSSALSFDAAPSFYNLRLENASFSDFFVNADYTWTIVGVVHFALSSMNFSAPLIAGPPEARYLLRGLSFTNNNASFNLPTPDIDVGVGPSSPPGSQVNLALGRNITTVLEVRIEHVDVINCSTNVVSGAIMINYDQHVSSVSVDHVRVTNFSTYGCGGVWVLRSARRLTCQPI
jgi:hypothetical protein